MREKGVLEHEAPTHYIWVAKAEEADARLGQDSPSNGQGAIEKRQRQNAGRNIEEDDPHIARARDSGCAHKSLFFNHQDLGANDPGGISPEQNSHSNNHIPNTGFYKSHQDDDKGQKGNAKGNIGQPHQNRLRPTAIIAGQQADDCACNGYRNRRRETDQQGGPRPKDQLREDVSPQVGRAQPELGRWWLIGQPDPVFLDHFQRTIGRNQRGESGDDNEEKVNHHPGQRHAVPLQNLQIGPPELNQGRFSQRPGHDRPAGYLCCFSAWNHNFISFVSYPALARSEEPTRGSNRPYNKSARKFMATMMTAMRKKAP